MTSRPAPFLMKLDNGEERFYSSVAKQYVETLVEARQTKGAPLVLGLATGGTMEPLYAALRKKKEVSDILQESQFFGLDEYAGLPRGHSQGYWFYYLNHVLGPFGLDASQLELPGPNMTKEFDQKIEECGGIDLQLLGIGENGHLAFNEPPAELDSGTHLVALSESTRRANARYFSSLDEVPTHAYTMGMGSIRKAKRLLLLARGEKKAAAIRATFEEMSADWPASLLQDHPNFWVFVDEDASSLLA